MRWTRWALLTGLVSVQCLCSEAKATLKVHAHEHTNIKNLMDEDSNDLFDSVPFDKKDLKTMPPENPDSYFLRKKRNKKRNYLKDFLPSSHGGSDQPTHETANPLLGLYFSLGSRRFKAAHADVLESHFPPLPDDSEADDETIPVAVKRDFHLKKEAHLLPIGAIHNVALDGNDTHHFFWRVLGTPPEPTPSKQTHGEHSSDPVTERKQILDTLSSPAESEDKFSPDGDSGPVPAAVRCEVHSRGAAALPWIAVGFSDKGELPGADLCVFWMDWKGQAHFQNALVDGEGRMVAGNAGVCRGFRYRQQRGLLKLTFYRPLDTCLPAHYTIERGTTHLVWSYGSGPLYRLGGVLAAGEQSGSVSLELLKPTVVHDQPPLEPHRELKVLADHTAVPADETTYWCTVVKLPDEFQRKHHVLQYSAAIQAGNEDIVHHMEVFHCEHPVSKMVPLYTGGCHAADRPPEVDACKRVLAAWAMGATPFTYPQEAGLPIGGADFNPYVMLEVHYNNPTHIEGRVDSSGISLQYTRRLRHHDASIIELGLEYTEKMAVPPGMPSFVLSGYCVPECTALGVPREGIFIFGSQLHTHLTGVRVWTKHYRAGHELEELNRDNHYSPHFQEIRRLPHAVHVLPDDSLVTSCEYRTMDRVNATIGGFAISDEMCVNYVHYYPKVELEVCKSSVDTDALVNYFDFMNKYELQDTGSHKGWRDNYHSIDWTPMRAQVLAGLYAAAPLSMQCNKSSGDRFPGYWDGVTIPTVLHELPILHRKCETSDNIENFQLEDEMVEV